MNLEYVKYYDNVLDLNFCNSVIEKFETNVEQQKKTVKKNHLYFTEINIIQSNGWEKIRDTLFNVMQKYLVKYMEDCKIHSDLWPKTIGYEEIRMKRYMPNTDDEFKLHVDVNDYASARRFLVYFFYLNTVETGGETIFQKNPKLDYDMVVKPTVGRLIFFPPLWTYPHIGAKTVSDPKYIIGGYLHYV